MHSRMEIRIIRITPYLFSSNEKSIWVRPALRRSALYDGEDKALPAEDLMTEKINREMPRVSGCQHLLHTYTYWPGVLLYLMTCIEYWRGGLKYAVTFAYENSMEQKARNLVDLREQDSKTGYIARQDREVAFFWADQAMINQKNTEGGPDSASVDRNVDN